MRIILLAKSIDGGTGSFFLSLMKLVSKKIQIIPCVLERPTYRLMNQHDDLIKFFSGGYYPEVYHLNLINVQLIINELIWIQKIVNDEKPDIVISIDLHAILLTETSKFLFRYKYKHIATIHNNIRSVLENKATLGLKWILLAPLRVIVNNANILVTVSSLLAEDLKDFFRLKKLPLVIHYGIPSRRKSNSFKKLNNKKIIILSTARLCEQKDHYTLIEAFYRVQKNNPRSELWLAGDGPLKEDIFQQIIRHKLEKKVKMLGWVQNPISLFQSVDIFVLSTKREGFPYVLLEAMQAELPIISTDCYFGPREILDNGKYGELVPVGDENELAKAINSLLRNLERRREFSKMSRERAKAFSEIGMLNRYLKLIYI